MIASFEIKNDILTYSLVLPHRTHHTKPRIVIGVEQIIKQLKSLDIPIDWAKRVSGPSFITNYLEQNEGRWTFHMLPTITAPVVEPIIEDKINDEQRDCKPVCGRKGRTKTVQTVGRSTTGDRTDILASDTDGGDIRPTGDSGDGGGCSEPDQGEHGYQQDSTEMQLPPDGRRSDSTDESN